MHSAPSVSWPVGRSREAERLLLAVWLAGACCVAFAVLQMADFGWRAVVLGLSVLFAGLASALAIRRHPVGELGFDGQHWSLSGPVPVGAARLVVCLDLQSLMLLHLRSPGGAGRWLWIGREARPSRWRDLRRAVYSRAPTAEPISEPANRSPADALRSPS